MKDNVKCQHAGADDVVYKEVVVIGNGPSGMVTSFMLAGNVPYLKPLPDDLPIDEMLRARLSNLPEGQSLYETDLMELAEGLEGRSQNPIPLLMDNLLRPCADLGIQADSLIEWRYDAEKQIDHIVLGRGPPGGAWHTFPPDVRTLSPAAWLTLPPHAPRGPARLAARAVANYCRRYVQACRLQRYFRCGVVVTAVTRAAAAEPCGARACPRAARYCVTGYVARCIHLHCTLHSHLPALLPLRRGGDGGDARGGRRAVRRARLPARRTLLRHRRYFRCGVVVTAVTRAAAAEPCGARACPRAARYCVTGYEKSSGAIFRYTCSRVVVASGAERANTLAGGVATHSLHSLQAFERAATLLAQQGTSAEPPAVLVVGSGVSAADGVWLALRAGLRTLHAHRAPAPALASLPPQPYPDYSQVYRLMVGGAQSQHPLYTSYPSHVITSVTPLPTPSPLNTEDIDEFKLHLKRVTLLNTNTKQTTEITVNVISVFIGSKPDLNFLQTNFNLNCIDVMDQNCQKCLQEKAKRKMEEKNFLKNHWDFFKNVLGQSIQSCKSRYLGLNEKCICGDKCDLKSYAEDCVCENDPFANGIGFGIDSTKPVDSRNPVAVDKSTHEMLNAPKGMYALGPLTADNFMRFIPGGALALVAHMQKEK